MPRGAERLDASAPCVPGLARDEDLAGVHDAAGQARRVDGAQRRAELDDVGPDQGLGQQARVLPGGRGLVLTCTREKAPVKHHFCNTAQNTGFLLCFSLLQNLSTGTVSLPEPFFTTLPQQAAW